MSEQNLPESHCMIRVEGEHEAHEHESLIGVRQYWCPGGEPPASTPTEGTVS